MQRAVEELREDLQEFVEQREALTLVLWAKAPTDPTYAMKLLGSLDEVSDRDVFVLFPEDCYEPSRYVDSLMAACDMDIDTGNQAIEGGAGSDDAVPWESLPPACFEEGLGVQGRIRALVEHIRRYYPDVTHRLVFAFLPMQLTAPAAYAEFVRQLLPQKGYEAWMAGVRFILLDSQRAPLLVPELSQADTNEVLVRPIDFSADALSASLVEEASDPSTPEAQRMTALVQVAALDHAWKRYDEALRKYGSAYAYYLAQRNEPMQSTCLLFAGHSLEQMGRLEEAKERYRQSLELAIASDLRQLILNASMALGRVHQAEQDWSSAVEFWTAAAFTAKALNNPWVVADASENAGLCRLALNDVPKALEFWSAGKEVAQQVGYWDRAVAVLEHLVEVERRQGMRDELPGHERELAIARSERQHQQRESEQARAHAGGHS